MDFGGSMAAATSSIGNGRPQMCVNDYNFEDGRLRASIRWLITRIYSDDAQMPDTLRQPFTKNKQNRLELTAPVIACLSNGSFYCQAASRIFRDNSILTNTIGSVFHALAQAGIDIRDAGGACITESMLASQTPFQTTSHLLFIDALMTAHLRSIVSTEKVVQAIANYAPIEKREEPLDCVDALLFWINKICLLVRDDVERHGTPLNGGGVENNLETIIPEMEDLYEDLCDGACICTLASFYRPNEIALQEICFKDAMSVNDCKFNLEILKKFCSNCLPWNPFHFEIDDILFLHESLQPNVNAFLADLFYFFEGHHSTMPVEPEPIQATQPVQRRFVQIQPIPDLRATSQPKQMTACGVGGKFASTNAQRLNIPPGSGQRDRAFSSASTDTAMTGTTLKSRDSLSITSPRPSKLNPDFPVTHFGAQAQPQQQQQSAAMEGNQQQQQNQPPQQSKNMAQIRLQLDGMRRELARRQQMESAKQEQKRNEASKDAFFRVISRNNTTMSQPNTTPLNGNRSNGAGTTTTADTLQRDIQELPNQFSQMEMTANAQPQHHYDQPQTTHQQQLQQPNAAMTRSAMQLNQQTFPTWQQGGCQSGYHLRFEGIRSHQQTPMNSHLTAHLHSTSTPQNDALAQQHYAAPQHANLSPIGPPPPGSILYSSGDATFQQQQTPNNVDHQQQQNYAVGSLPRMPSGGHHYFGGQQQPQQNFTPIPNGAPPLFHHQLAMAHQQPLPPQPTFNQQQPILGGHQNVYPTVGTAQFGAPNANYGGGGSMQQPSATTYFSPSIGIGGGGSFNPSNQNNPIGGGGGGPGIQLQPSFSQPSHLHLLHQQQPQPQIHQQQQQFQQPLMFNTPGVGGQQFGGAIQSPYQQQQYAQMGGIGQQQSMSLAQQQHPSSTIFGSTATMFQSTETLVIPPHQSQLMQQHNFGGVHPATILEQQTPPPPSSSVASPFRLHQSNAPASRLDPQLELNNKDLTNWGMMYRAGDRPQRKTWAQKQAEQQQQNASNGGGSDGQNFPQPLQMESNSSAMTAASGAAHLPNAMMTTTNSTPPEKLQQPGIIGGAMRNSVDDEQFGGGGMDGPMTPRASGGVVLEDATEPNNSEMTPEMQAKRRVLLAKQIRREQQRIVAEKEMDAATLERRQSEMAKMELAEQRKSEREQRRQKLLEDYKRKKMEQELGDPGVSSSSGNAAGGGGGSRYTSSTVSLNRGHSQPPFRRPKSQTNLHIHSARTLQRPDRTQSNMMSASINGDENFAGGSPRVPVPSSIGEPQLKLFAKVQPKSNRSLIMNALQYSVFPGHVSNDSRQKAQAAIATSDSKHFLILFRDHRLQYRGIYTWDQFSDTIHRIEGNGPKVCKESMMTLMFKYDSGAKSFGKIPTKHLSATIDGFVIDDQYWQKPKIPHSGR